MEEVPRVADYLVIAGLPRDDQPLQLLDDCSLEVNLKQSAHQDPITDITVIIPSLGETTPDEFQLVEATPSGLKANLNFGSFRSPEVLLCYRRGRDREPLLDLGVLYEDTDRLMPDSQLVEFTPTPHSANVNNALKPATFLTYRRSPEKFPCNQLVVMDVCVIVTSKGETPPHSFVKINKSLNRGLVGSDVYLCLKKSMNRPNLISYKPDLLSRFPLKNNVAYNVEDSVAFFCLPMGANLECWPQNLHSSSVCSSFVLTLHDRSRVYGSAITFYEKFDEQKRPLSDEQQKALFPKTDRTPPGCKIVSNKCVCLLSRWPFFDAFEKFLFFLYKTQVFGSKDVPLERFISHFLYDVPFPSPSRPRILIQLSALDQIALFQPEELPLPRSGASFRNFLQTLGVDNCLLVLLLALTEQKILIHSHRPDVLTSVAEAVIQIIFPFYWQCPYIPLCPIGMSDYLSAPLPFVMGFDSGFFDLYDQPSDVNAVDLDSKMVTVCQEKQGLTIKTLPKKASRQLRNRLEKLEMECQQQDDSSLQMEATRDESVDSEFRFKKRAMKLDMKIREAFLHFMVSVLSGYRHFLLPITSAPKVGATDADNLFDQKGFLRSRDRNFQRFYTMLTKTQMFTKFIEERSFVSETNTCLAFFDECMERTESGGVPDFLEYEDLESDRTLFILPPDCSKDFPENTEFKYDTFTLNPDLFPERDLSDPDGEIDEAFKGSQTPASASMAKRTRQEIRSAQKMQKIARDNDRNPFLWSKCLINTSYSLWFIHLPSYMLANKAQPLTLRSGLTLLQRMKRLRLHPADEICYRVMMQLCHEYDQPILAVKVLFEMKAIHLHPNAVTYGYYNRAVLESKWPEGEASRGVILWGKLRNLIMAITILKVVAKEGNFLPQSRLKSVSSTKNGQEGAELEDDDEEDFRKRLSSIVRSPGNPDKEEDESAEKTSGLQTSTPDDENDSTPNQANTEEEAGQVSQRLSFPEENIALGVTSINSPHETPSKPETKRVLGHNLPVEKPKLLEQNRTTRKNVTSYTNIRGKHANLFQQNQTKSLDLPDTPSSGGSEGGSKRVNRSLFKSESGHQNELGLSVDMAKLDEMMDSNSMPKPLIRNPSSGSLRSKLVPSPVTESDPLGAISGQVSPCPPEDPMESKTNSLPHSASQSVEAHLNTKPRDNILGSPFAEDRLARSATLPLDQTDSSSSSSLTPSFSSFRNLTKSGGLMTNRLNSLKKGGSYFSSYLSPGTATQKKAQDALNQSFVSVKSVYNNVSKRVEEIRESVTNTPGSPAGTAGLSPASSYQYLATPERKRDEDAGSTCSTDSRRPSTVDQNQIPMNDQSETWSSLTGQLWEQFWGTDHHSGAPRPKLKASDITEPFENLYMIMPKQLACPMAMEVQMTSCSECTSCRGVLYDEEIMSGWTAEDSNLTTQCAFCKQMFVPWLYTQIVDYRFRPKEQSRPNSHPLENGSIAQDVTPSLTHPSPVQYLSPLVLRKRLEHLLETEGDACLLDPKIVQTNPIIFWNLIWYFERIGVKSHLPGLCLSAAQRLAEGLEGVIDDSWAGADHKNVQILCRWDNKRFHSPTRPHLYTLWQVKDAEGDKMGPIRQIKVEDQHPSYKGIMDHVIHGVQENDLLQPLKTMLERRKNDSAKICPSTPTKGSPPATPSIPNTPRSVYREIMYLILVSLGQDNIDLTAFDREYLRAYRKLSPKYKEMAKTYDEPPSMQTQFCRKLFRELKL
ncbi:hypothetical protein TCAL_04429 [Tigriopus californicus]|uniref:UDENN domain-containing protein n=1 Tax=Tigriopus californicus TaxID=6832 RepID=A0A553NUF1_TIGCA|nr:hypothetical protein TCAL_04429 [Tigriopus californicus]